MVGEDIKRDQITYSSGYTTDATGETVLVFIHGVTGDTVSSWTNEKTGAYFPALLGKAIPSSLIYRVGYYTPKFSRASTIAEIATGRCKTSEMTVFSKTIKTYTSSLIAWVD